MSTTIIVELSPSEFLALCDREKLNEIYAIFKGEDRKVEMVTIMYALADALCRMGGADGAVPSAEMVGRLLPQKGVDLLLRAVALLPSPRPSILILGDGPARGALEGVAADLGFGSSIRFLSGVQHDAVRGFMAAIDVLVLPSRTTPKWKEQFGRVLVEGMAAGCVVVGSSSGAIPEVVGDAGLIFPEDDVEGLAEALRRVLGEPGLGEALRIRGRKRVRAYYTWEAIASRINDFYARLLAA